MKRFLVKLVFNVAISGRDTAEFEEQLRVLDATNHMDALFKGRLIGKKEECSFLNSACEQVTWQFIDVADVYPLSEMDDGEQVFSQTHLTTDGPGFITYTKQRSMEIQVKNLTFA